MTPLCLSCGGDIERCGPLSDRSLLGECTTCHMLHAIKLDEEGNIMGATQDISSKDLSPERKELLEKLRELQTRHNDVKGVAKAMAKDYREQLADIDGEIKDTLEGLKETA